MRISFLQLQLPVVVFSYVRCTWLLLVLFGLLVVSALSVLAGAGVLLCADRPS
jgi:hypothetical protein